MLNLEPPCQANQYHQAHAALLLDNYRRLLDRRLLEAAEPETLGRQVFEAGFVLLSHDAGSDPLFNYGNRRALELFELSWDELVGMPSRFSAEPVNRQERDRLLAAVADKGYIDNYSGVRIAKSGTRFMIHQAVVWNIYDRQQVYCGQAACFKEWTLL